MNHLTAVNGGVLNPTANKCAPPSGIKTLIEYYSDAYYNEIKIVLEARAMIFGFNEDKNVYGFEKQSAGFSGSLAKLLHYHNLTCLDI